MKTALKWFAQGVIILVPMIFTVYGAARVFKYIVSLIPASFPGGGFIPTIALITFVGFLGSNVLKGLFNQLEVVFSRLPLLKILYGAVKDLLEAFAGEKKKFDKPVTVKMGPSSRVKLMGFITQQDLAYLGMKGEVTVYCPHSYNFSGQMMIVPKSFVKPLKMDSSDVMSMVVSGGVAGGPEEFVKK